VAGTVVVIGATGPLGRRVTGLLAAAGAEVRSLAAAPTDLVGALAGASAVVHLGRPVRASHELDGTGLAAADEPTTTRLLGAVLDAAVERVVWLSTAMVYGAWPDNPIPLTETAPARPNPGLRAAEDKGDRDRQVLAWAAEHPDVSVVVLRPAVTVGGDNGRWLTRSPWKPRGVRSADADAPSQFVHVDDVAAAVALAATSPLRGVYNVAPDGWIPAEQLRALCAPGPRVHLPAGLADRVARLRWRIGLSGTPPAVLPYTRHPWVVANDRLRAAGWKPDYANDEAFVVADVGGFVASLNPRQRQLLSLGAVGAVAAALVGVVVWAALRRSRRSG
jgi:nucleoside-diphosphate-sugar epimerase